MKNKIIVFVMALSMTFMAGCGDRNDAPETSVGASLQESNGMADAKTPQASELPDGIYTAEFQTDSSMFRVNETCDGKGILTVENGIMTIHISLGSKKIIHLYPGLAEDAAKDGVELLQPTEDVVTYSDGMTETVYGFDVPVPVLGEEFDLALIGTKGVWYDHKVSVSDPVPTEENGQAGDGAVSAGESGRTGDGGDPAEEYAGNAGSLPGVPETLADGTYKLEITFEGGSGKAQILSPVTVTVTDGKAMATVQWNSPNYDYMIVEGEKYLPINTEGDSVFEIPVPYFEEPMDVIGDTVAMSKPHEVEYTITFHLEKQ